MKLKIQGIGLGLINAQNNEIILAGGLRSGNSEHDVTRRKYVIYDKKKWIDMAKTTDDEVKIESECNMGFVELFVKDGKELELGAKGLVNIEIKKACRKNGIAKKVLNAIRETTGEPLKIHDIKKHVASVWRKLGVTDFQDDRGNSIKISKYPAARLLNGVMPAFESKIENKRNPSNDLDEGLSL